MPFHHCRFNGFQQLIGVCVIIAVKGYALIVIQRRVIINVICFQGVIIFTYGIKQNLAFLLNRISARFGHFIKAVKACCSCKIQCKLCCVFNLNIIAFVTNFAVCLYLCLQTESHALFLVITDRVKLCSQIIRCRIIGSIAKKKNDCFSLYPLSYLELAFCLDFNRKMAYLF